MSLAHRRLACCRFLATGQTWLQTSSEPRLRRMSLDATSLTGRPSSSGLRYACSPPLYMIIAPNAGMLLTFTETAEAKMLCLAQGLVALLGDSAHAMQPNLGQGGCMAIEDGYQLAVDLSEAAEGAEASGRSVDVEGILKVRLVLLRDTVVQVPT